MRIGCLGYLALITYLGSSPAYGAIKEHGLIIGTGVPPATILVIDEQGRRAGVDPMITLDEVGRPPVEVLPGEPPRHRKLGVLMEIPRTDTDVQNIGSDEPPYEPQRTTGWYSTISDGGTQTYTVILRGLQAGASKIYVRPLRRGGRSAMLPVTYVSVLVDAGKTRELRVAFDPPGNYALTIERAVSSTELAEDVQIAWRLGQISPEGVCRSLEAKADAVREALKRGRGTSARAAIKAFLEELKAQGGKHVHEPALTILREEAEALLNPPPPMPKPKKPKSGASAKPPK